MHERPCTEKKNGNNTKMKCQETNGKLTDMQGHDNGVRIDEQETKQNMHKLKCNAHATQDMT